MKIIPQRGTDVLLLAWIAEPREVSEKIVKDLRELLTEGLP